MWLQDRGTLLDRTVAIRRDTIHYRADGCATKRWKASYVCKLFDFGIHLMIYNC